MSNRSQPRRRHSAAKARTDDCSGDVSEYGKLIQMGMNVKGCVDEKDAAYVQDVVHSHDMSGRNYIWLEPWYGKVLWIDFAEPSGSGEWRTYDRYFWARHACAVDHEPDKLVESHVRTFVDPKTKIIDLLFWFQKPDGSVYSTAPTEHFYQLEADYFRHWALALPQTYKANTAELAKAKKQKEPWLGHPAPLSLFPKYLGGGGEGQKKNAQARRQSVA